MNALKLLAPLAIGIILGGCAHPIVISPDINKITPVPGSTTIKKNVAYYVDPALSTKIVKTGGGGGDFVQYTPYKDTEMGFYKMLTNVFSNVTRITSLDKDQMSKDSISYIISPDLVTNSSSSSALTWPPTQFDVTLTSKITDPAGNVIAQPSVSGSGSASFSEFKSDFSLSGKRAVEDALQKMQQKLLATPEINK